MINACHQNKNNNISKREAQKSETNRVTFYIVPNCIRNHNTELKSTRQFSMPKLTVIAIGYGQRNRSTDGKIMEFS